MTFAKVLEAKIRKQIQYETVNALPDTATQASAVNSIPSLNDTFLSSYKISPITNFTQKAHQAYKVTIKTPAPLQLTDEESFALNELSKLGANLTNPFTGKDLKKVHRSLALKFHPDLGGCSTQFISIKTWISLLEKRTL